MMDCITRLLCFSCPALQVEAERQERMARFSGATAISSADYMGRSGEGAAVAGGGGGYGSMAGLSAAAVVNQISLQVCVRLVFGEGCC
jgi:hypothetical protein